MKRFVFSLYEVLLVDLRRRVDLSRGGVVVVLGVVPPLLPGQGEVGLQGRGVVAVLYHRDTVLSTTSHLVPSLVPPLPPLLPPVQGPGGVVPAPPVPRPPDGPQLRAGLSGGPGARPRT